MVWRVFPTLFLLLSISHPGALADEPVDRLSEVVVTATKTKTPAKRVTRAVSTIPAERLDVTSGAFLSEGLSDVPETLVRRTGIGLQTSVVVRGAGSAQVHITLDGAHVGSPTTGAFDFNHLTPENLEKVEILKGPAGALYGSDAMGGVINLVTRRGEGPFTASYTQEVGGLDTFREVGLFQGASGPWHLSGSAARIDSSGLSQNDDYQNVNLSSRIGYDLTEESKLDLSVRHLFAIVGVDDGAFRPDPNRRDRERQTIGSAKWEAPVIEGWWAQTLKFSAQINNLIDNDPSNGGTQADSLSKLDTERYGVEWMNRLTPVDWDTVTVGFDFEDREADRRTSGANQNFSKTQTTRAAYLHNEFKPNEALTLVNGVRFFRESAFGSDQVLENSLAYFFPSWNLKLRGGFGEGFRVPSLNDLFFPNFGNPNLAPEKSRTVEVGADGVLWEGLISWSGTLFRTDFDDLIQFVRVSPTQSAPQNVGKSRVDGTDWELELRPSRPWTFAASYTHLEANARPSDEELLRIPKNTLSTRLEYAPSERFLIRLEALRVSSREEFTFPGRDKTKGYLKLNLKTQVQFKPWLKGHIRIENLTDRSYSEVLGFPAPGTVATVGITVEQ